MAIRTQWHQVEDLRSAQDELAQMHGMLAWALGQGRPATRGRCQQHRELGTGAEHECTDAYLVTVELPGVALDDLQITMQDGRVERRYGAFRRSIIPASPCGRRRDPGLDRQWRAADRAAPGGPGQALAHDGAPWSGGRPCRSARGNERLLPAGTDRGRRDR
jgi:hypothetical protein